MPWPYAVPVVLGAVVAVLVAWRARRIAHHLALEMVQNRTRLAALERAQREGVRREAGAEARRERPPDDERTTALAARLADVERHVAGLVEEGEALRGAGPEAASGDEAAHVRDLVRAGLHRQGYRRVYVLDVLPDQKVVVEAERSGTMAKGVAWIEPDGQVVLRSRRSHRAFP